MDSLSRKRIDLLESETLFFEKCVRYFSGKIGKPVLVLIKSDRFPRYKNPSLTHFQLLMSVRIVSAFNASLCLIENGYTQETAVLIRTICEFTSKMFFAQEAYLGKELTKEQKKILKDYFSDEVTATEDLLKPPKWWANMKSIHASEANITTKLSQSSDPNTFKKLSEAVYYAYSRYVHGAYNTTMEMYESGSDIFRVSGMPDTTRVRETVGGVFQCVVPVFSAFLSLSQILQLDELQQEIVQTWKYHISQGI